MTLYLEDKEIDDLTKQATKIKIAVGDEGIRQILVSGFTEEQQRDPRQLWNLLEEQLDASVKINYRVHRLELSQMKQKPEETITDYVSRLCEKITKCEFDNAVLNERLIEMIIWTTPFEEFRKELMAKPNGHPVPAVLAKDREYEVIQASEIPLKSMYAHPVTSSIDAVSKTCACNNCRLHHAVRACPAYHMECSACDIKGHRKKNFFSKLKDTLTLRMSISQSTKEKNGVLNPIPYTARKVQGHKMRLR